MSSRPTNMPAPPIAPRQEQVVASTPITSRPYKPMPSRKHTSSFNQDSGVAMPPPHLSTASVPVTTSMNLSQLHTMSSSPMRHEVQETQQPTASKPPLNRMMSMHREPAELQVNDLAAPCQTQQAFQSNYRHDSLGNTVTPFTLPTEQMLNPSSLHNHPTRHLMLTLLIY